VPRSGFDAILVLSFGGPECRDDVIPFLENVLRGRNVPRRRLLDVAEHYYHFGGVSPINQHCRELISGLRVELDRHDIGLPIYWGNRNWRPFLVDTLKQLQQDGCQHVLTYVTAGFSCYSGCRQYREDITKALGELQEPGLRIEKLRGFYNHPDFVRVIGESVARESQLLQDGTRDQPYVVFTAHSIPETMARSSDYERQLNETCRLVADYLDLQRDNWSLVYQSRSGRPQDPWLEPDILDFLRGLPQKDIQRLVICPVGFLSDHMEVLFDLDEEAADLCSKIGITMRRARCPGNDARFIAMIRKLFQERLQGAARQCTGQFGPQPDHCPDDCCPGPVRVNRS
jgi:protoporphyrin/coproporphyrin ferrochelatase